MTLHTFVFLNPLNAINTVEAQVLEASDRHAFHVYDIDNEGATTAAVLIPGSRPFPVEKPDKRIDMNTFHFSSTPLNERLLGNRKAARRHLDGDTAAM